MHHLFLCFKLVKSQNLRFFVPQMSLLFAWEDGIDTYPPMRHGTLQLSPEPVRGQEKLLKVSDLYEAFRFHRPSEGLKLEILTIQR